MELIGKGQMTSLWKKHPFVAFGLPFITAVLAGFVVLTEVRSGRYLRPRNARLEEVKAPKRSLKSLEEELKEWESKAKAVDYEMKPVK